MHDVGSSPTQLSLLPSFLWHTFTNLKVILGLTSAVVAAVAWTMAVSRSELSIAYPFMGLAIVLVLALSPICFGESIPWTRWCGVIIVCVGIWLTAQR
jgi:drug/metabolite transporter (DMT)-like permease